MFPKFTVGSSQIEAWRLFLPFYFLLLYDPTSKPTVWQWSALMGWYSRCGILNQPKEDYNQFYMNLEAGNAGVLSLLSMKHFQTRIKNKKSEFITKKEKSPIDWPSVGLFSHSQSRDIHVKLLDDSKYVVICITAMTCIPPLYLWQPY